MSVPTYTLQSRLDARKLASLASVYCTRKDAPTNAGALARRAMEDLADSLVKAGVAIEFHRLEDAMEYLREHAIQAPGCSVRTAKNVLMELGKEKEALKRTLDESAMPQVPEGLTEAQRETIRKRVAESLNNAD